jgi:hypothetical protein
VSAEILQTIADLGAEVVELVVDEAVRRKGIRLVGIFARRQIALL